jgi:hypothetical protein
LAKFAWRSRLMLDPKRIRATTAVAIRHLRAAAVPGSSPPCHSLRSSLRL